MYGTIYGVRNKAYGKNSKKHTCKNNDGGYMF